jgi:hypothetical protein
MYLGFESDGNGGISAQEFANAIHCLMYDVTSKRLYDENMRKIKAQQRHQEETEVKEIIEVMRLMSEIAESILIHDRYLHLKLKTM